MKIAIILTAALVLTLSAQTPPDPDLQQQYELQQAVSDATSSPVDVIRNLEAFLRKYPQTRQRALIEQTILKAAMDSDDNARIVLYGEKALPNNAADTKLIDRLTRALLDSPDPGQMKAALDYAKRYEATVIGLRQQPPPGHLTPGQWSDELDLAQARALALEARAAGNIGGPEPAAKLALQSWQTRPTGEGARELAYWLIKLDRTQDAIEYYADAFTLEDSATTEADRASDRRHLGELYAKLNGSEKGLGETILQAYDRTSALIAGRRARLKARDPNAVAENIEDFVLPAVAKSGAPLTLSSLKGKTVVMDFWATWCAPCRIQKPIIESIRKSLGDSSNVVFVPVDADDDRSLVEPFLKTAGWNDSGYFEAGLAQRLTVSAIPTVVILDPSGKLYSRLVGFVPDRFEKLLRDRIQGALTCCGTGSRP